MLTAWSFGGVLGPLPISRVVDATGAYATALYIIAELMLVSTIVPLIARPPKSPQRSRAGAQGQRHEHKLPGHVGITLPSGD